MVVWLFIALPWVCLQFVIVVFPDHTPYFGTSTSPQHTLPPIALSASSSVVVDSVFIVAPIWGFASCYNFGSFLVCGEERAASFILVDFLSCDC